MRKLSFKDVWEVALEEVWPIGSIVICWVLSIAIPSCLFGENKIDGTAILPFTPEIGWILGISFFLFIELYFVLLNKVIKEDTDHNGISFGALILIKIFCLSLAMPSAYIVFGLYLGVMALLPFMGYILMGVGVLVLFVLLNMGIAKMIHGDEKDE